MITTVRIMVTKVIQFVLAACVLSLTLSCSARGFGRYSIEETKVFFHHHRGTFEDVVVAVSKCRGAGVISIYPDGSIVRDPSATIKCPVLQSIASNIRKLGVLWVNVSGDRPYGKVGPMGATFVLTSSGLLTSGHGSAICYYPDIETNPFGDSVPLSGKPGHWFYRSDTSR